MKKFIPLVLLFGFVFTIFFIGCPGEVKADDKPGSGTTTTSSLTSISISQKPSKLIYEYDDTLDLTGIIVKAVYSDGTAEEVEGWTSNPKAGSRLTTSGTITVTISYETKTASFTITVAEKPTAVSNEYFWGTWVRMDNGKEYEVLESNVKQGTNLYAITDSSSSTLTVKNLGTFTKQSDSVMVCENIPYFRKGGANLEYSLKLVGFTNTRAAGSVMSGIKGKGRSSKYKGFESSGESDSNGEIKLKAPTTNDTQTVEITNGNEVVVVPGLKVINTGDYMGTVALVGKDDYNLKITGTISDDQKDNGYLYGNNAKTYEMVLTITNISENKCSTSGCSITTDDTKLHLSSDTNLTGFTISTLAGGATKTIKLNLSYGAITKPYVDTGINVTIKNPLTYQEWTDYIPLRFFKGTIPITIAAKNPENNNQAALNGFVIYPDGNNQFFAIKNNSCSAVFVPTFGASKPYMLVFSGATVTSTLSDSTEMYYTVEPASLTPKTVVTDGELDEILGYISFGGNNHSETNAYDVTQGFESYLSEGEIDYYKITADSDDYYGPGGSVLYSVSYVNDKGDVPDTFLTTDGAVLSTIQLPEMTCKGYKFLGWYSGTTKAVAGSYTIYDNITLTAKWQLESYSVTYNLNGGTNNSANPSSYTIESSAIMLQSPALTGYDFGGWFLSEELTGSAVENIGGGTTGAITLYAKWSPTKYTITYNLNGGTNATENPASYTVETETITLAEPQKENFAFGGWFTDSSFSGTKQTTITKGSNGNKTYYAKWLKKCTVQFQTQYGTTPDAIIIGEGETFTADQLPVLTDDNHFLTGWYDGETLVTAGSYVVTKDLTLTAQWRDKCTVSYVSEHGSLPQAFVVAGGTKITAEKLPTLTERGWKFLGWYTNSSFTEDTKVIAGQTIVISITLYAKWEEYTGPDDGFIFVEGGTVVGSSSYNQNYTGAFPEGRTVTLSSFYISDHELTQGEYETYCCYTSSTPSSSYGVGTNYPAYYVSWYDAIVYCNLKSMAEGLTPCYALSGETDPKKWTGIKTSSGKYSCSYTSSDSSWNSITCNMAANGYRLPTEAEWEYAARGGQQTYGTTAFANYFSGAATTNYTASTNSDLNPVAWYYNNSGCKTHEVKKKNPNALGLYDMSGNVCEWCWDWYGTISASETVTDPCGASSGSSRLLRGGCWYNYAYGCSVSYRSNGNQYYRGYYYGFRLVRSAQ